MEQVYLEQGSQEWLEWRRGKRMASETAAVMGISPYSSPAQVRKIKQGRGRTFVTDAMQRGQTRNPALAKPMRALPERSISPAYFTTATTGPALTALRSKATSCWRSRLRRGDEILTAGTR